MKCLKKRKYCLIAVANLCVGKQLLKEAQINGDCFFTMKPITD